MPGWAPSFYRSGPKASRARMGLRRHTGPRGTTHSGWQRWAAPPGREQGCPGSPRAGTRLTPVPAALRSPLYATRSPGLELEG